MEPRPEAYSEAARRTYPKKPGIMGGGHDMHGHSGGAKGFVSNLVHGGQGQGHGHGHGHGYEQGYGHGHGYEQGYGHGQQHGYYPPPAAGAYPPQSYPAHGYAPAAYPAHSAQHGHMGSYHTGHGGGHGGMFGGKHKGGMFGGKHSRKWK